jgi:predicted DNA-binding transcriptional regulator AlpA
MTVSNIDKQYLRTPEAAAYCGLSASTLEKLRLTGDGPFFIKRGRSVLYDRADLDGWLDSLRRRSTSDRGGVAA